MERNHIPQVHAYPEHILVVLHTPEKGEVGHIHLRELEEIVGHRYLITVHGPINPKVPLQSALAETDAVWERIRAGKFRPDSPNELSYAIGTAIARRQQALVTTLAGTVADLEQRVMSSDFRQPEPLLEEMFLLRHELLVIRTMAHRAATSTGGSRRSLDSCRTVRSGSSPTWPISSVGCAAWLMRRRSSSSES
jgi:magnesium transporter